MPQALAFFNNEEKRVIENITQSEIHEIKQLLNGDLLDYSSSALKELEDNNVIYRSNLFKDYDFSKKYSRQVISYCNFTDFDSAVNIQSRLENMVFIIIGVGGAGCNVISQLMGMGVERYVLIDPDTVEVSNLNRQVLFDHEDVGALKVEAAKKHILKRLGNSAQVEIIPKDFFEISKTFKIADPKNTFVVSSADSHQVLLRKEVAKTFYSLLVPYAYMGYSGGKARIGPFVIDHKSNCGVCSSSFFEINNFMEVANGEMMRNIAPSSIAINTLMSSIFSINIVRWLSGKVSKNIMNEFNTIDFTQKEKYISGITDCEICGNRND